MKQAVSKKHKISVVKNLPFGLESKIYIYVTYMFLKKEMDDFKRRKKNFGSKGKKISMF